MKTTKFHLFVSIFELVIGLLAVGAFVFIATDVNENTVKWIGTFVLAIAFIVMGITGIISYHKGKK